MVDSITPAATEELKDRIERETGLRCEAPVQREAFLQWVVEDILGEGAPDLASVGVMLTKDVAAYELAKLRLLNGAHSTLAYAGLMRGLRFGGRGDGRFEAQPRRRADDARRHRADPAQDAGAQFQRLYQRSAWTASAIRR
jgi:fructuronate reductase